MPLGDPEVVVDGFMMVVAVGLLVNLADCCTLSQHAAVTPKIAAPILARIDIMRMSCTASKQRWCSPEQSARCYASSGTWDHMRGETNGGGCPAECNSPVRKLSKTRLQHHTSFHPPMFDPAPP